MERQASLLQICSRAPKVPCRTPFWPPTCSPWRSCHRRHCNTSCRSMIWICGRHVHTCHWDVPGDLEDGVTGGLLQLSIIYGAQMWAVPRRWGASCNFALTCGRFFRL